MNEWLRKRLKEIGILSILVFIGLTINFYVKYSVSEQVNVEKIEYQSMMVKDVKKMTLVVDKECDILSDRLNKNDLRNSKEHQLLKDGIEKLASEFKKLSWVIIKNNKNVKKDLEELKDLSIFGEERDDEECDDEDMAFY